MAANKKSFVLYTDQRSYFDKLNDQEAGQLIKHIFSYVNDENPNAVDRIIDLSFEPIKLQLKRDLVKYESISNRNKSNGKLGGRPKQEEPKKPTGLSGNPNKPKKADTDNDTDNDTDINKKIPTFIEFRDYALQNKPLANIKDLKLKYDSWVANGWKDGNNKKIVNWKSKILNTLPFIKESTDTPVDQYAAHMRNLIRP
jgi:hypothetical protein